MVDDKDDASREERQQKHKEKDFDPPRVRQCVTRSVLLPFFSFSRVEEQQQQQRRTQNAGFLFFSLA